MNAQYIADTENERLLRLHDQNPPVILIQSGPGAGKSWLLRNMAILSLIRGQRVLLTVKTNHQAWDMLRNITREFPRTAYSFVHSQSADVPIDIGTHPQIQCTNNFRNIPNGPVLAFATGDKCGYSEGFRNVFDVVLFDEAYQFSDASTSLVSSFARRWVFIGDSGQIKPVVTTDTGFWNGNVEAPYLSAPEVLQRRHPGIQVYQLPVTRRLPADSIPFIQPPFYPNHPFVALTGPTERRISFSHSPSHFGLARMISKIHKGASMLMPQLPHTFTLQDTEILDRVAQTTEALLQLQPILTDGNLQYTLRPQHIGIACSNVIDVSYLQNQLSRRYPGTLIETFHRFQGLERPVMLIVHPLSGQATPSPEAMETGLLCVGLSRHRNLCLVFAREGLGKALDNTPRFGESCMNEYRSAHSHNWNTHTLFMKAMKQHDRIIPF
ncbi:MAG: hypothetical protein VX278_18935 [Myxococcota bacterium]|nr:hypothetical protein [Myxococcota bacterium]